MGYQIIYTARASKDLEELKRDKSQKKILKAVCKAIRFLAENPKHPSLQTHQYHSLLEIYPGQKVWEAYAQDKTPAAYRLFWSYGPSKDQITILAI
ncbi:MAG: type II toxin-antitoxin system RelE/ParE family toxin [Deltaproteobacteria bacterium]|nr:type II toxin-antitoxin system RelE/ParE family toxin [Deltaproteobacteria bacterium]